MARPAPLYFVEMLKMDIIMSEQHHFSLNLSKEDAAEPACCSKWPGDRDKAKVTLPGAVFMEMNVQGVKSFPFESKFRVHAKDLWFPWDLQSCNSCMLRVAVMLRTSSSTGLVCNVAELLVHCWWFWGYVTEIWITFRYARERKWHKWDRNLKNAKPYDQNQIQVELFFVSAKKKKN